MVIKGKTGKVGKEKRKTKLKKKKGNGKRKEWRMERKGERGEILVMGREGCEREEIGRGCIVGDTQGGIGGVV